MADMSEYITISIISICLMAMIDVVLNWTFHFMWHVSKRIVNKFPKWLGTKKLTAYLVTWCCIFDVLPLIQIAFVIAVRDSDFIAMTGMILGVYCNVGLLLICGIITQFIMYIQKPRGTDRMLRK